MRYTWCTQVKNHSANNTVAIEIYNGISFEPLHAATTIDVTFWRGQ